MAYVKNASTQKYVSPATDTTHSLSEQIEGRNEIDDILVLNIGIDAGGNVAAVAGWTEYKDSGTIGGTGHVILWRRATAANETLPDIVTSASAIVAVEYIVVYGCPTGSTPIGNTADTSTSSNLTTITWTGISYSANSTVLFLASIDGASRTISAPSTGLVLPPASGSGNAVAIKKFYASAGSTGNVTATINAADAWIASTIEFLDNGNGEVPIEFAEAPAEALGLTTHATTQGWRDSMTAAQVDPRNGNSIANTKTFDASTNVSTVADTITITGHGYKTGTVVKADANGNTLPTGMTDGAYYFVHVVDANTIKLMLQNAAITVNTANVAGAYYDNDTTPATIDITATGTGTCRLINAPFMWVGFNSSDTIIRPNVAIACHHNFYCIPLKFSSPLDMTDLSLVTYLITQTGADGGEFYVMLMDSSGDYKSWKVAATGKPLTASTAVVIEAGNTVQAYESGTFDSSAVEHIILFYKGNANDDRLLANLTWNISTSLLIRPAQVIGGTGTVGGTWQDVYGELILYTAATSSYNSLAPSQLRFLHLIQLGDGTNALAFDDESKALSFDPASDGSRRLTKYVNNTGVLLYLSASDSVTIRNQLLDSSASFNWKHNASSSASATVSVTSEIYSNADLELRTGDTYTACTFVGCKQILGKAASLTNCTISSPNVSAGEAAILFDANGSQTGLTIDVTGTSADYHIALGSSVTAFTLTDVTLNGTPGTNKLHVKKTSGTVTITATGSTSLVAGDITSDGATVVLVSGASVTISGLVSGSEVRAYVGTPSSNTLLDSTESSGTSFTFSHTETGNAGFITIRKTNYVFLKISITYAGTDTTIPVKQQEDRVYANP
jgi:hypothetical protein